MAKKYLLYIHYEQFDTEEHKSELVNNLLRDWYGGVIKNPHKANREPTHILKKKPITELLEIPGVVRASEIKVQKKCSGNHYMDRSDCGLPLCPWGASKG